MNNIAVVAGFVLVVLIVCKIWGVFIVKKYEKELNSNSVLSKIVYGEFIDKFKDLELKGCGDDGNSDFEVKDAIEKTELPDEVRVKLYD